MKLVKNKTYDQIWLRANSSIMDIIKEQIHPKIITLVHFNIRVQSLYRIGIQVRDQMILKI